MNRLTSRARARRGGMYVAVLGVAVIVTAMALGILFAARVQGANNALVTDTLDARLYAEAGVDATAYYLGIDPNWRTNRPTGTWWSNVTFGQGTFTIAGTDANDSDISNRPTDPLVLRVTGTRGSATHTAEVRLRADGQAVTCLGAAISTVGQLHIRSGRTMNLSGALAYTAGQFRNDGTLNGRIECLTTTGGTVTGTTTIAAAARSMPPANVAASYQALARSITGPNTIDRAVLGPGFNSLGGGISGDGVYMLNLSSNLVIQNSRICGTLIIVTNGKTVTITGPTLIQPARSDYPALIVVGGKLILQADSSVTLSEAALATNFNPSGAPFGGTADSDQTDTYPCEIQGLVHCTGQLLIQSNQRVRGAVIAESNAGSDAVDANDCEIIYDSSLSTSPPMGYVSAYQMKIIPGTWKQIVAP